METKSKVLIGISSVIVALGIGAGIFFGATPVGRRIVTGYNYDMEKAGENNYENRKKVEDQCRAYISSYNADKLIYEQYKNSDSALEKGWSESARTRANTTAVTYNNYFLRNSYIFKDNIPNDICSELKII